MVSLSSPTSFVVEASSLFVENILLNCFSRVKPIQTYIQPVFYCHVITRGVFRIQKEWNTLSSARAGSGPRVCPVLLLTALRKSLLNDSEVQNYVIWQKLQVFKGGCKNMKIQSIASFLKSGRHVRFHTHTCGALIHRCHEFQRWALSRHRVWFKDGAELSKVGEMSGGTCIFLDSCSFNDLSCLHLPPPAFSGPSANSASTPAPPMLPGSHSQVFPKA